MKRYRIKEMYNIHSGIMYEIQERFLFFIWHTVYVDRFELPFWFSSKEEAEEIMLNLENNSLNN